jgi:hypothetical protein
VSIAGVKPAQRIERPDRPRRIVGQDRFFRLVDLDAHQHHVEVERQRQSHGALRSLEQALALGARPRNLANKQALP